MNLKWEPIENAPKDRDIILFYPKVLWYDHPYVTVGKWYGDLSAKISRPYWRCQAEWIGINSMRNCPPTHYCEIDYPGEKNELC